MPPAFALAAPDDAALAAGLVAAAVLAEGETLAGAVEGLNAGAAAPPQAESAIASDKLALPLIRGLSMAAPAYHQAAIMAA